jgi:hypothetical protein
VKKLERKLRKITKTEKGAMLLNIAGFVPSDADYVFITASKKNANKILLTLELVDGEEHGNKKNTSKTSNKTKSV